MKKPILLLLITVLLIAIGLSFWYWQKTDEQNADQLTLYGNIDIRQVELVFHEPEYIATMLVREGESVRQGQPLATQDLTRFQQALDSAAARVEAQRQAVERLVTGSRPEEISSARAEVKSAQASLVFAEKEWQRYRALVKDHLISKETVDQAHTNFLVARERLQSQQQQLRLLDIGPRDEDIAEAKALLKYYQSQHQLAEKDWHDAHLYAPADGIIQERLLEPGAMANNQTPVYTLALTDPVWARVYATEAELGRLQPDQSALIYTDSYPDKGYDGWVGFVSPTAEFTPKTVETPELRTSLVYQVRVYACNRENELRLGMPVTVEIALTGKKRQDSCQ